MTALTWSDLANLYDKHSGGGRPARTLPMEKVSKWAASRKDLFFVDDEDSFHLITEIEMTEPNPTPTRSPIPAPNVLLMGDSGTGKTYAIRTLIEAGITPHIIFTEPGMEVLGDLDPSSYHFHYVTAPEGNWAGLIDTAEKVNKFNFDMLTKMTDQNRNRYGQFVDVLSQCNNFVDSRTGEEFGDCSKWGTDRALVLDSLSGLSDMAMRLVVGGKPTRAMQDWMVAQNLIKSFLDQCTNQLRCTFVVIAHLEREKDEITGGTQIMVSTLGRALAPKVPIFFSDVIQTIRQGSDFFWDTSGANITVKTRNLPIAGKLAPSFVPLIKSWKEHGGVIETSQPPIVPST